MVEQALDLEFDEDLSELGDPLKWRRKEWEIAKSVGVHISCGHPGCRNAKTISCSSPVQLRYARKSAQCEIFYCHSHRLVAWEKLGIVPDFLLPNLRLVQKLGACNKAKSRLAQGAMDFLVEIGLLSIIPVRRGANTVYQIKITDAGEQHLAENAEQLALYLSHQVKDSQIEWNWVPSNTDWPNGAVV